MSDDPGSETDIAIIGMGGHFPGAADVDQLWARVLNGDDCLTELTPDALAVKGVPISTSTSPDYVRRSGIVDQVEFFDPGFFGIGPRDAAIMDPQHRHFLECAWEALESGGVVPERFEGAIGVFAGCGMNTYLINNLLPNRKLLRQLGWFLLRHTGNDKDFLATTLSYRLDLRGPSINVQTACSTSLVAVHLAVQSLLAMECDIALAGGATIEVPHGVGYEYQEGEILSPDGYCRAFDAESAGTVLTSGAGVVALRRLTDAWDAGDPILAVIKGSAVNNDGARKVSYLAPSVDGHAEVVKEALTVAGIGARDLQLLEAHGTGTAVGDPIEVAALTEAFRATTDDTGFCRLSSTKPNIGHLDTAAGIASLIKVVQALRHETLPPLANHTAPSPLLDLEHTPFTLSGQATAWPAAAVRRAGISSLGVGGTNAHVVVEEAPRRQASRPSLPEQVLALSGRDSRSVADAAERLAARLESEPELELGDVALTLAAHRRHHPFRRVVTATDLTDAIEQLRHPDRARTSESESSDVSPDVVFLFPGGGSQYPGMATGFDERFDVFHDVMSDGIARIRDCSGIDLGPKLSTSTEPSVLNAPTVALPLVFLTSLGLARQWLAWGVEPAAYVGHSLGEYVAAHLAGVLTFHDALTLVMTRASLMEKVGGEAAAMLVVPLGEPDARALLTDGVSLAAVNADDECVIAGRSDKIADIERTLAAAHSAGTLIPLAAAAHSTLLDPVLDDFRAVMNVTRLSPPTARYASNQTGGWIGEEQATDPDYWVRHLRDTVRFSDNLRAALSDRPTVTVELGPGQSLTSYARRCVHRPVSAIASLRHSRQEVDDTAFTLHAFARQWVDGVPVGLEHVTGGGRRTLRLPTYPFQRQRYWFDPPELTTELMASADIDVHEEQAADVARLRPAEQPLARSEKHGDMWWEPGWRVAESTEPRAIEWRRWWVITGEDTALADLICHELAARGCDVRRIEAAMLSVGDDGLGLSDGDAMLMVGSRTSITVDLDSAISLWLGSGIDAVRALGGATTGHRLALVTRGAFGIGGPASQPVDAVALGIVAVAPREYPDLDTIMIDVESPGDDDVAAIVDELTMRHGDEVVAIRADQRLVCTMRHCEVLDADSPCAFIEGATYVITGGLGAIGHTIAMHLARSRCNLAVVTSTELPPRSEWSTWMGEHGPMESTSQRLRRLLELESLGARVQVVVADLARPDEVHNALDRAEEVFGGIDGVIHAAGSLCDRLIAFVEPNDIEVVIGAKARAAVLLSDELRRRNVGLLLLVSSTSTFLAPPGQVAYVAANAVLDSLAGDRDGLRIATINFGVWSGAGMAQRSLDDERLGTGRGEPVANPVFEELVTSGGSTAVVGHLSTRDQWLLDEHRTLDGVAVLPGTGHLELLIAAIRIIRPANPVVRLESVTIHEALAVPDDRLVPVRVTLSSGASGMYVEFEADAGPAVGWRLHASALLVEERSAPMDPHVEPNPAPRTTLDAFAGQREKLQLGPRWHPTASGWISEHAAFARIELADPGDSGRWRAHPALIDAGTGLATQLVRSAGASPDLLVPIGYDAVTSYADVPLAVDLVVTSQSTDAAKTRVDLRVYDEHGVGLLAIEGIQLWAIAPERPLSGSVEVQPRQEFISLNELSDNLGIRPDEGVRLVEQFLASGRPRLVASSVELDRLRERVAGSDDCVDRVTPAAEAGPIGSSSGRAAAGQISKIWKDLLGVDHVVPDDNFFDLGGHSLIAIRLMTRLHRELGVRLQLNDIFAAPSLAAMIDTVTALSPTTGSNGDDGSDPRPLPATVPAYSSPERHSLVQISAGGSGSPLFIVHGAGGNVLFLWSLGRALSGERAVFGFQAAGVDARDMPDPSIEAMATRYITELRASHDGPYLIGGYSGGGLVALEMSRQLIELGEEITQVILFDSVPPGCTTPRRLERTLNLAANFRHGGWSHVRPYVHHRIAGIRHRAKAHRRHDQDLIDADERALGVVDNFVNLFPYFSATAERYELATYEADVTVLKADDAWPVQPHDYYWSRYIKGTLDIRTVPGNHRSMFYPELVPRLAAVLRECFAQFGLDQEAEAPHDGAIREAHGT